MDFETKGEAVDGTWFDYNWVWIGTALGCVLAAVLLFTDKLRSNTEVPRRRDLYWLGWACSLAYFIHNIEEYGISAMGATYAFPDTIANLAGMLGGSGDVPAIFFTVVHVSMVWIAFPLLAFWGKKRPLASLVLASMLFMNAVTHAMPLVIGVGYTAGAVSAIVLFFPLTIWMFVLAFGKNGTYSARALLAVLGVGIAVHAVLMGSVLLFVLRASYPASVLVGIQFANAALLVGLGWIVAKSDIGRRALPKAAR